MHDCNPVTSSLQVTTSSRTSVWSASVRSSTRSTQADARSPSRSDSVWTGSTTTISRSSMPQCHRPPRHLAIVRNPSKLHLYPQICGLFLFIFCRIRVQLSGRRKRGTVRGSHRLQPLLHLHWRHCSGWNLSWRRSLQCERYSVSATC